MGGGDAIYDIVYGIYLELGKHGEQWAEAAGGFDADLLRYV